MKLFSRILPLLIFLNLFVGDMPFLDVLYDAWDAVFTGGLRWTPLLDERVPRLLTLALAGGAIAIAGVVMQSLFSNPLASPTTLGVSLSGILFGMIALKLGLNYISFAVPMMMIVGVFISLLFFLLISHKFSCTTHSLLMLGLAFSTLLATLQGAIHYYWRHDWAFILSMSEWLSSSTQFISWHDVTLQFFLTALGLFGVMKQREALNLLSLGEEEAYHLGLNVKMSRFYLISSVSALIAGSLITVGELPFLGLIIPHICRSLFGSNHSYLLKATLLVGVAFLITLDTFQRLFEWQVSLNHLTGFLGALFFFFLLLKPYFAKNYAYN